METQARAIFKSFMQKHGVPRSTASADLLSFGWLENAPEGDAFVGSHGRVFDVIVMIGPVEIQVACAIARLMLACSRAAGRYCSPRHHRQPRSAPMS